MPELTPVPIEHLVARMYLESQTQQHLFELPKNKWYLPAPDEPDMSLMFHGHRAGNPSGPAAGPQTQMAQNILLSYAAGGRILELKTIQVNDRLTIPRPCIDMQTIGYNVEWSQELLTEQSLVEYVAGMMLIEIFKNDPAFSQHSLDGKAGEYVIDMSVGYDLKGIKSEKVQKFLDGMRDATSIIETLRGKIPQQYKLARDLNFKSEISTSVSLSTFHGCPANEIEGICEFLIAQRGLDVIVKMNPTMLGKEKLEHLLHDVLGYTDLRVNQSAYTSGLLFDEALGLVNRLSSVAKKHGRSFGCKFSNTLEVENHRTFFTPDNKVQYLSGQPLHVITMTLTDEFRQKIDPQTPISFSAGIDKFNFASAAACGFAPASVCTDLLRPGGYGRLGAYMKMLGDEMKKVGASDLDSFILKAYGHESAAKAQAKSEASAVKVASVMNTTTVAAQAREDKRYRADVNRKVPNRIDSHLTTFNCITCDKCIPVCPNAANFTYPTPKTEFDVTDLIISPDGSFRTTAGKRFAITKEMQIANFSDFCNECGNCDTFCPEYGGPYIQKPGFHATIDSWKHASPRDGFVVTIDEGQPTIRGRIKSMQYKLTIGPTQNLFTDFSVEMTINPADHSVLSVKRMRDLNAEYPVDMSIFHTLRFLLTGVLDKSVINQVNVALQPV